MTCLFSLCQRMLPLTDLWWLHKIHCWLLFSPSTHEHWTPACSFFFFSFFLFMLLIRELSNGAKHCLDFLVGRVFRDFSFLCNCRENKSCLTVCSEQHVCHWLCGGARSSSVFNLWGMTFVNTPSRICEACWLSRPSGCSSAAWHAEMTNWQSDSLRWKNTNKKSLWHLNNER